MNEGSEEQVANVPSQLVNAIGGSGNPYLEQLNALSEKKEVTKQPEGLKDPVLGIEINTKVDEDNSADKGEQREAKSEKAEETEGKEKESQEDFSIESPLLGGKHVFKGTEPEDKDNPIDTSNLESLNNSIKERYGIDSVDGLFKQFDNLKELEQSYEESTVQLKNAQAIFANMDPELYNAVVNSINGGDWRQSLNTSGVDYSKDVDSYDVKKLVEGILPGKVTQADWEEYNEEDGDPSTKRFVNSQIEIAKEKFVGTKESRSRMAEESVKRAKETESAFNASLQSSAKHLSENFSGVNDTYIKNLEKDFKENKIMSYFYDDKGALRDDAMLKLAMLKDAPDLIAKQQKMLERRFETKVNEEILSRGLDKPNAGKGSATSQDQIRPEVQKRLAGITGINPTKHF